jgi:hypothetical protein
MCTHEAVACTFILPVAIPLMHIKTHTLLLLCTFCLYDPVTPLLFSIGWSIPRFPSSIAYPFSLADMMQLTPFLLILGVLFRVTLDAYAIPLAPEQRGVVTLPLQRTPMRRDVHPHLVCPLVSP